MDEVEAVELTDRLIYQTSGKHLNDLERNVFIGSWSGKSYAEIHPVNPQYIEKYVAYNLWKKLSEALGEKVGKKTVRGALDRWKNRHPTSHRVLIGHHGCEPDTALAREFQTAIARFGHGAFLAVLGATGPDAGPGTDSLSQIDAELRRCDYLLLLLSPRVAVSEMAIETLRRVRELQDARPNPRPTILPIRIDCPPDLPLNHDLRSYLIGSCQREWRSPADTDAIIREVLSFLADSVEWGEKRPAVPNWETWKTVGIEEWDREIGPPPRSASSPPLPVAEPELPKGQVRLDSAFYVRRVPEEDRCYQAILNPGALIRLKAPRQMGKTSLMARILAHGRECGCHTVPLSFQHADGATFSSLNQLLRWFCARVARKLRVRDRVEDYWTDTFGSKDNCTAFFEDCLLPATEAPLILGLDEVDRVFQYPKIADDFFSLLRAWYEEAGYGDGDSDLWERLRLVIVHSTEVYIPLDINQSPFNVGFPVELSEFTPDQVLDLTRRHGLNWGAAEIEQLTGIVGGHPYLVRLALYHIARDGLTLGELAETAATESGIYGDHLRRHLWSFQQHPELAQAFQTVASSPEAVEVPSVLAFKLHSMGLVHFLGDRVRPRFELYRTYFSKGILDFRF